MSTAVPLPHELADDSGLFFLQFPRNLFDMLAGPSTFRFFFYSCLIINLFNRGLTTKESFEFFKYL